MYTVDANGRITNPGKFENERAYVPYFHEQSLEGFADSVSEDGHYFEFILDEDDYSRFPILRELGKTCVHLFESDLGFVIEIAHEKLA